MQPEEPLDDPPGDTATTDDIRQAIEGLSKTDFFRLRKAAVICLYGTEYKDPSEILNEVIVRTMNAANGGKGRRWPKAVPFMAYLIQTMKGLADDSRESSIQTKTEYIEAMVTEGTNAEDAPGLLEHCHSDVVSQAIELGEIQERVDCAKVDAAIIDAYFDGDSEVSWIIMGHKDGQSAAEIRELAEMSQTQYETARKRFRRGLEKLFPGRRAS